MALNLHLEELENDIKKTNKEIASTFDLNLKNLKRYDLRTYLSQFIRYNSLLPEEFYSECSDDQLILLYLAIMSDVNTGSLLLLAYPNFSKQKLEDLTYILKERNFLSMIIDTFVLLDDKTLRTQVNRLKRGMSCFKLFNETTDDINLESLLEKAGPEFDHYFLKILDYFDPPEQNKPKEAKIIAFKKLEDLKD